MQYALRIFLCGFWLLTVPAATQPVSAQSSSVLKLNSRLTADSAALAEQKAKTLVIGTIHAPPFVIRSVNPAAGEDSVSWSGLSIDLWRETALALGLRYRFVGKTLTELSDGLEKGELDVVVAAMTVNPEREKRFDFTHPFFRSGIGIATSSTSQTGVWQILSGLLTWNTLLLFAGLFALLCVIGTLLHFIERRHSPERFGKRGLGGLGEGLWWAASTLVGSSDGLPVSLYGRLLALVWISASTVLLSTLTATIAAALTSAQLQSRIESVDDLRRVRVGTVTGSSSEAFLTAQKVAHTSFPKTVLALQEVAEGRLDAVVADAPIMRYLVLNDFPNSSLTVLSKTLKYESYGFGLRPNSVLREDINRILLEKLREPRWEEQFSFYSGD